jgi:hypothetical protein
MPEGVGYNSNIVAGTGLEINVVGNFAYAYSGNIASGSSGSENTFLDFRTGNYLLKGRIQFCHPTDASENMTYKIYFNGIVVQQWINTGSLEPNQPQNPVYVVIPPYTEVQLTCSSSGSARGQLASITARVYK